MKRIVLNFEANEEDLKRIFPDDLNEEDMAQLKEGYDVGIYVYTIDEIMDDSENPLYEEITTLLNKEGVTINDIEECVLSKSKSDSYVLEIEYVEKESEDQLLYCIVSDKVDVLAITEEDEETLHTEPVFSIKKALQSANILDTRDCIENYYYADYDDVFFHKRKAEDLCQIMNGIAKITKSKHHYEVMTVEEINKSIEEKMIMDIYELYSSQDPSYRAYLNFERCKDNEMSFKLQYNIIRFSDPKRLSVKYIKEITKMDTELIETILLTMIKVSFDVPSDIAVRVRTYNFVKETFVGK